MEDSILLVTHACEGYDRGMLEGRMEEAVKMFPGETIHISDGERPPYGGEDIYNHVFEDEWQGMPYKEDLEKLTGHQNFYRAGAQYNNCCGNTDLGISVFADGGKLTYLTDLTIWEKDGSYNLLEERPHNARREGIDMKNNLSIDYTEWRTLSSEKVLSV